MAENGSNPMEQRPSDEQAGHSGPGFQFEGAEEQPTPIVVAEESEDGMPRSVIAAEHGISKNHVDRIIARTRWAHVK